MVWCILALSCFTTSYHYYSADRWDFCHSIMLFHLLGLLKITHFHDPLIITDPFEPKPPQKKPPTGGGLELLLHFHWRCRHGTLILVVAVHVAPIPLRSAGLWRRHGEIRQLQRREEVHVLFRWYDTWQRLWIWDLLQASKVTNNRIGTKKTIKHIIFSKSKVEVMLDSGSFGNIKICWYSAVKQLESPHCKALLSEVGSVWSWVWSNNHIWS